MTFGSVFGRTFSPTFQPSSQAAAVASSWWLAGGISPADCVAAYQPKGAASYSASKLNLANPGTYDAYEGTAPSWSAADGWTFNGSSQYLRTDIIPTLDQSWSAFVQFTNKSPGYNKTFFGVYVYITLKGAFLIQHNNANLIRTYNGDPSVAGSAANSPGMVTGNYGFSGRDVYRDGLAEPNSLTVNTGTTTLDIAIGALHIEGGTIGQHSSFKLVALSIYSTTLTAIQVAALTSAMAAL